MSEETETNPVEAADNPNEETAPETQEVEEQGLDDQGNPIDPDEEVDLGGLKLTVPASQAKTIRDGILMQADYTRKTQEVAEQRAAVQAERQALHQTSQAELDTYARAQSLAGQLAQYQQIDWRAWHDQDPFAAAAATSEYQMLRDAHQATLGQMSQLRAHRLSIAQQETARRIEQGRASLVQDIPEWSDAHRAKLIDFAAGYGFSRQELDDLEADPRVARVLHAAFTGKQTSSTARKVQNTLSAQAVQPAATVKARGAPATGLADRLSADEWMRRRNAQDRKRRN